jgi:hypothetical protein
MATLARPSTARSGCSRRLTPSHIAALYLFHPNQLSGCAGEPSPNTHEPRSLTAAADCSSSSQQTRSSSACSSPVRATASSSRLQLTLPSAPAHSIIRQASDSRLRLDAMSLNADGFGVGWCVSRFARCPRERLADYRRYRYPSQEEGQIDGTPGMFKSCTPACVRNPPGRTRTVR